jgi:hypothetical protein
MKMTVSYTLPRLRSRLCEACATDNVVESALAQQQHLFTRVPLFATGGGKILSQMPFAKPIIMLDLLLLVESLTVVGRTLSAGMHSRRLLTTFISAGGTRAFVNQST